MSTDGGRIFLPHRALLVLVVAFLYLPIVYVVFISFNQSTLFPFPFEFTLDHYREFFDASRYRTALVNSLQIAVGAGLLSMILGSAGAWGVTRFRMRGRYGIMFLFVLPLLVPTLITGVASARLFAEVLNLPKGVPAAILTQTVHGVAFAFLIMLTQLSRYPSELDEIAQTYGASTLQRAVEVTIPLIWPGLLGAFLLPFILAFNNFDLTFYTVGANPTLPTVTWGQLRHGIRPTLFALSALIVMLTLSFLLVLFVVTRRTWRTDTAAQ